MSDARLTVTLRVLDLASMRLFVWELRMLADEMRIAADPYAERLERALDRFTDSVDDEPESES